MSGVLTSCVCQWVWCIPPSVPGKLTHVVLTWTFQKGKQSWPLPVEASPVILQLSRSQPFAKPMKVTDAICPLPVRAHVPTVCDTVRQHIPPPRSPLGSPLPFLPFSGRVTDAAIAHSLMSPALQLRNTCSRLIHRRQLKPHSLSKHSLNAGFVPGPVGV